jgi:hypothetical protein
MENIIDIILAFGAGWAVAWRICEARIARNMASDPDNIIRLLEQIKRLKSEVAQEEALGLNPDQENVEVEIEVLHGPVWYAYRKDNGEFLSQSSLSLDDAMQRASDRFPGVCFWTPKPKGNSQPA